MPDYRAIPSIEQLRQRESLRALEREYGRDALVQALRDEAAAARTRLASGAAVVDPADIDRAVADRLRRTYRPSLHGVVNATGVIIHTNLGRAPLADAAARRVAELAAGYCNLEYDLREGARGSRNLHAEALLRQLTGAEAAVVVNNNAAATLILLAALSAGREAIISRGELVEIGGGFRVPDVMAQSGAILREVGTTNKTRAADYAAAIGERTGLILRVHPSNFRIEGFTERPALQELVALGRQFGVAVAEDLGSGYLRASGGTDPTQAASAMAAADEPAVEDSVAAGADLVCFSGDKLLGGPQCGIIVGREERLRRIRTHPLMRALRVDKMTYAALEATLLEYLGGRAPESVPVARMIGLPVEAIEARARAVAARLGTASGWRAEIVGGISTIGGGSAPGVGLPTRLLAVSHRDFSAEALEAALRALDAPIIARVENDRVVLDLRTVLPEQDEALAAGLLRALR